ncbi:hypothetical protein B0T14DRAFT_556929 [Immersiella caudata]|uniref:Uncharacterized protein n=1 Tax=Immersiella caudata TaxID=314043 RepID=A0AA40BTN9_9PEZI|nr:hypothetical protein B0T14DRAFT_556929 [Immersiella caudata]
MHVSFCIIGLLSTTLAFIVPPYLPNGAYHGTLNNSGQVIFEKLSNLFHSGSPPPTKEPAHPHTIGPLHKRGDQTGCPWDGTRRIDAVTADLALDKFKEQVNAQTAIIPPRKLLIIVQDKVFWFGCNYNRDSIYSISNYDLGVTLASIDYKCGRGIAGWDYFGGLDVTIGVEAVGYGVCENMW